MVKCEVCGKKLSKKDYLADSICKQCREDGEETMEISDYTEEEYRKLISMGLA